MLHLILGQSGTGKTSHVLEEVKFAASSGAEVLLIVPEHASFEMERRAYSELPARDAQHVNVLSFPRLAENIFRDCGGLSHRALDDMSRIVIMRMAVDEVQDSLMVYRRQLKRSSFLSSLLDAVQEWKRAGVTPIKMQEMVEQREENQLTAKLRDFQIIYTAYQAIVDRSFHDPLDDLTLARKLAVENCWFDGREIWVDGFDYFSVAEREMLDTMLESAKELTFSMTTNDLDTRQDIFVFQKKFLHRLLQSAAAHNVRIGKPNVLSKAVRFQSPSLVLMQQIMTDHQATGSAGDGSIRLLAAQNSYDEVLYAAAEAVRLVREEGYRYRDIAILCRDLDRYEGARDILQKFNIPYFCSEKDRLSDHALPMFLCLALDAASGTLRTESLLHLARSEACGISAQESGELENYCYIWSISGRSWLQSFTNNPDGMSEAPPEQYEKEVQKIEKCRIRLLTPVQHLGERLHSGNGGDFARAIYEYVRETNALQNLSAGCDRNEREKLDREWNCIVDILDLFTDFFTDIRMDASEYLELFSLALSKIDLGEVPNTVDHIAFAEVDRVRLQSPRAVFVLGVNEGLFPASGGDTGLFSTREREELNAAGIELPVSGVENALREQYVLYTALSSPAERLYISCARSTLLGEATMAPSALLLQWMNRMGISMVAAEETDPSELTVNIATAKMQYAREMDRQSSMAASLRELLLQHSETDFVGAVESAARDDRAPDIRADYAKTLLGPSLMLSPTAIDTFYQCPYLYFCDKLLRLRPRQKVEYSPFESGSAIHYVFEKMIDRHGSKHLIELSDEEREQEVDEYLREYISRMVPDQQAVSARFRYQFARLKLMLGIILRHMALELSQSEFIAAAAEVKVGAGGEIIPPALFAEDGTPVEIRGSIDRVDLYHAAENDYLRVIDYKSGEKDFRLEEVYYGLNMQMLIYLYSACDDEAHHFGKVEPAGILYAPSKISAVETAADASPETMQQMVNTDLRMKGLLLEDEGVLRAMERELAGVYIPASLTGKGTFSRNSRLQSREQFLQLRELVYHNITEMANRLLEGKVSPNPIQNGKHSPCDYCHYATLCNNSGTKGRCKTMEKAGEGEEE